MYPVYAHVRARSSRPETQEQIQRDPMETTRNVTKVLVNTVVDCMLSRRHQLRIGQYLMNRAKGEGNGNPSTNGEYAALRIIKRRLAKTGGIVFDVGANRGEWTREVAAGMPATLSVFSFEPMPATFRQLEENVLGIKTSAKIRVVNLGLSDFTRPAVMYADIKNPTAGSNSIARRNAGSFGLVQHEVAGISLVSGSEYCIDQNIAKIDYLKIDTEGHELSVIRGFANMLKFRRIGIIQFEYGGAWIDSKSYLSDAFELLGPYGYAICRLHSSALERFSVYDQREETFAFANYVAVAPEFMGDFQFVT